MRTWCVMKDDATNIYEKPTEGHNVGIYCTYISILYWYLIYIHIIRIKGKHSTYFVKGSYPFRKKEHARCKSI